MHRHRHLLIATMAMVMLGQEVHAACTDAAAPGVRARVEAMEKVKAHALVPAWPWVPLGKAMRHLPLPLVRRIM